MGPQMIVQLLVGIALIGATVYIHAVALNFLDMRLRRLTPVLEQRFLRSWRSMLMTMTVLGVFLVNVVQLWIWAVFYLLVGELPDLESALYFSTSTFTTVGYGDVVLSDSWRLLSSFEAANGMILFGWSTAFIFSIMRTTYHPEHDPTRKV